MDDYTFAGRHIAYLFFRLPGFLKVVVARLLIGVCLLPLVVMAQQEGVYRSMDSNDASTRPGGFSDLMHQACLQGKPLLLVFKYEDDRQCQRLEAETLSDPLFTDLATSRILTYRSHAGSYFAGTNRLARHYGINEYPSLLLLDADARIVWKHQGFIGAPALVGKLSRFLPNRPISTALPDFRIQDNLMAHAEFPRQGLRSDSTFAAPIAITDNLPETVVEINTENQPVETPVVDAEEYSPMPDQPEFGIAVAKSNDFKKIWQSAYRWQLVWGGDIWVQTMKNRKFRLVLGSLYSEKDAREKKRVLRSRRGIRSKLITISADERDLAFRKFEIY